MNSILDFVQTSFPNLRLVASDSFYWSPRKQVVHFQPSALSDTTGSWSLLHEVGHALLLHQTFSTDFELLQLEISAWEKAKELAAGADITIPEDHIQDCLDTYREWLYLRSTCPTCTSAGQQIGLDNYSCINCNTNWQVSRSRTCRSYRKKLSLK